MNAKEIASEMGNALNSYSFSDRDFCDKMCNDHRTIQQSFTRLCVKWLITVGSDDYQFDGRNELSHEHARRINTALEMNCGIGLENLNFPLI